MRPPEFLYNLIDRFSPMAEIDRNELRRDASKDYTAIRKELFNDDGTKKEDIDPKKLKLKQKFVYYGESWPVRTVLALLFIGCLRWIHDFINPPKDMDFEEDD